MNANSVESVLLKQELCGNMKEPTLERNHMIASSVVSVFSGDGICKGTKKATRESLMVVNSVEGVSE